MIINFTIKNYRSFKEKTMLSLEASGAKGKSDNIAEVKNKNGKKFRLLKTAVIYGANASGKSNLIRGFLTFRQLISASFRYDVNDQLLLAEPFELSPETVDQPVEFSVNFIAWDKQQYIYSISVSKSLGVIEEILKYYPGKAQVLIYRRRGRKIITKNADFFKGQAEVTSINPKRLYLSELGNGGDEYWEGMRNYFVVGNSVINSSGTGMVGSMRDLAKQVLESDIPKMVELKNKVIKLVRLADLGVANMGLVEDEEPIKTAANSVSESDDSYSATRKVKLFKTTHPIYSNKEIVGEKTFDLMRQGSAGTFTLVGLSTEILMSLQLQHGRPTWIDEIDNSLHPYLCRFLIHLFNHPKTNPWNSQLIFATHETTLLDRNNFRKDQIWIAKKDKYGVTQLYSVYDLDVPGLRDDIPFDRWYMSGKFGGLPQIKELDFIFDRTENMTNG